MRSQNSIPGYSVPRSPELFGKRGSGNACELRKVGKLSIGITTSFMVESTYLFLICVFYVEKKKVKTYLCQKGICPVS